MMRILIDRELTKQEKRQIKKELTELMNLFQQLDEIGKDCGDKNKARTNNNKRAKRKH